MDLSSYPLQNVDLNQSASRFRHSSYNLENFNTDSTAFIAANLQGLCIACFQIRALKTFPKFHPKLFENDIAR